MACLEGRQDLHLKLVFLVLRDRHMQLHYCHVPILRCRESDPTSTITATLGGVYFRKNKIVVASLTSSRTFFNSYHGLSLIFRHYQYNTYSTRPFSDSDPILTRFLNTLSSGIFTL